MEEANGSAIERPAHKIEITYDPETQTCNVHFDPKQFKTYEFVLAVFELAKMNVDQTRKMAQMMQMQQQAMAAQQHQQIKSILRK